MVINGEGGRYALLQAVKDSDYVKKVYGGYYNLYKEAFGEEGERWDLFKVYEGEFPDFNELHKYDGFVITGSISDAHGNDYWILKLCFMLQTLDAMEKKVLGVCFGHQVLCRALGGRVGRSKTGWDIGIRQVNFAKDLAPCSYLERHEMPATLSIVEVHQDEVYEIPLGAEVIASSDKTGVEVFAIADHILGIQGHPEYTKDTLFDLIDRLVNMNAIKKGYGEDLKFRFELAEPDNKCWERICRNFLKGK
ncbi:gamma-glutamyl peptidase 5-like isoform X1 [Gastrolobium bilobum]|uniref:gamma-glutamyl peptidase 5-like isoform X1 n=1 Tax=Gastrolobium bilobum TaxID=150636 RepID=UPI002AB2E6DB|nr:gamma-glutamyl peptidase 5-like isoform X1 [Gastrolobium bilobum]